jgi:hypothetical protein
VPLRRRELPRTYFQHAQEPREEVLQVPHAGEYFESADHKTLTLQLLAPKLLVQMLICLVCRVGVVMTLMYLLVCMVSSGFCRPLTILGTLPSWSKLSCSVTVGPVDLLLQS